MIIEHNLRKVQVMQILDVAWDIMIHHKGKILMTSVGAHKLFVLIFPASCNQNQWNSGFQNHDFWPDICILHIDRISCFDNQMFLSILRDF